MFGYRLVKEKEANELARAWNCLLTLMKFHVDLTESEIASMIKTYHNPETGEAVRNAIWMKLRDNKGEIK